MQFLEERSSEMMRMPPTRYAISFPFDENHGSLSLTACNSQRKTQGDIGNGAQCHVAESNTTDDTIPQKAVAPIKQRYFARD